MPAGSVCSCGELTANLSGRCDRCEALALVRKRMRRRVYDDRRWSLTRQVVWVRDGFRCVRCGHVDPGNAGGTLDAHHVRSVIQILEDGADPFDPAECETLCKRCHGGVRR